MSHHNYWGMPMMWFVWFPIILIIILAVVKMLNLNTNGGNNVSKNSSMEILKKRFASGEITEKEFEERKRVLQNN